MILIGVSERLFNHDGNPNFLKTLDQYMLLLDGCVQFYPL